MNKVSIHERINDGRWAQVGTGELQGNRIVDCAADIGDDVYGALEGAIEYRDGAVVPGSYAREVGDSEYRVDVE
jgi:hypothetical protein